MSSAIGLKICTRAAAIKNHKPAIKEKKKQKKIKLIIKQHRSLISKTLTDSYISHDEFVSVKYALTYDDTKEEIKDLKSSSTNE